MGLKWNQFEANVRECFKELKAEQSNYDVTLVTDDGYQIQAHKIVLGVGSKFFKDIFRTSTNTNPYIYLKGIRIDELKHVLNIMYEGEANVAHEEVENFLETAQDLHLMGLEGLKTEYRGMDKSLANKRDSVIMEVNPKKNHNNHEHFGTLEELPDNLQYPEI
eukprot:TRINITY_DN5589_c0_g1_i1.p1 TRINITY_DN5589_c0_g1~~TRINITY_DN5589_c0_g1_i1.p1  ORF type:complete len:171 (-),score=26.08 TRINITY_DN5589_c0_g1_i1:11-499(-)